MESCGSNPLSGLVAAAPSPAFTVCVYAVISGAGLLFPPPFDVVAGILAPEIYAASSELDALERIPDPRPRGSAG